MKNEDQFSLKDLVKGKVKFVEYRKGNLWYESSLYTFTFPVPIEDVGDGVFLAEDKALLFMRYIRKHLETIQAGLV